MYVRMSIITVNVYSVYVRMCIRDAKQKHIGCKKSARPIRSHNGYISDQKL